MTTTSPRSQKAVSILVRLSMLPFSAAIILVAMSTLPMQVIGTSRIVAPGEAVSLVRVRWSRSSGVDRLRRKGIPVDGEVLRRLLREAGDGGVRVRDLYGRTGTVTAIRGGLAVVSYPDGVEQVDPGWLGWAGQPRRTDPDPTA